MGIALPKPVESSVIERHVGRSFRVGVAEVNGWRSSMEDAHLVHMCSDWAFFGVFDGHGGDQCSSFVAERFRRELSVQGCPQNDADVKRLVLGVDRAFLDTNQDSGSTGTMCIVQKPIRGGKYRLRIANVGDSRVLLGRRDGTIFDGGGTDQGLTIDHKPDHPSERERIYRCGGHVEMGEGSAPARVNGELSVSRCFGDASHKKTGGPGPEDHPVTANPELGYFECDESDFLLLVCDGVSEGDFPNAEVVKLVAGCLKERNDPGAAAARVCHRAIEQNSKDNVSCMVVLLSGSVPGTIEKTIEFIPGPLSATTNKGFMTAYESMAKRAGLSLAQAAEMRYDNLLEEVANPRTNPTKAKELREEIVGIGVPSGTKGSDERSAWFRKWEETLPDQMASDEAENDLICMLMARHGLGGGPSPPHKIDGRRVRVVDEIALRNAVIESPALDWNAQMSVLALAEGEVQQDDPSDGTSQVRFANLNMTAWLPTCAIVDCNKLSSDNASQGTAVVTAAVDFPTRRDQLPPRAPHGILGDCSARRTLPRGDAPTIGIRGQSPSAFKDHGARAIAGARLPAVSGRGRTPSPVLAATGSRAAAGGHRSPSPADVAAGSRIRRPAVRLLRSTPR